MHARLPRRDFVRRTLSAAAGVALSRSFSQASEPAPGTPKSVPRIIDSHTHFYDPTRPGGVPWPPKDNLTLYRTVWPAHYRALSKPAPVAGTVVVEASPWVEDNQWILDLAARDSFIVGFIGNLPVGTPEFARLLERFAANPTYRGIRVPGDRLAAGLLAGPFLADLNLLADRDLALEVVGSPAMLPAVTRLARAVPRLRIMIDHLAGVRIDGLAPPVEWCRDLAAAARHATVFAKVSGLVEASGKSGGAAPREAAFYRPALDSLWEFFGEDRLVYGSNWPVCELFADLATVQRLAVEFFAAKGTAVAAKVLAGNAGRFYRWEHGEKA